jgi:hypothetical protein
MSVLLSNMYNRYLRYKWDKSTIKKRVENLYNEAKPSVIVQSAVGWANKPIDL